MGKIFRLCTTLFFLGSLCFGSQIQKNTLGLTKAYVSSDSILFCNGCMLITHGENLLCVKTLHQDSSGVYYYYAYLYGECPNGHPYGADGGCLGYNCPFN